MEDLKTDADSLRFRIEKGDEEMSFHFKVPAGKEMPKELRGSMSIGSFGFPVWMVPTKDNEIAKKEAIKPVDDLDDLKAALELNDTKERDKKLEALFTKNKGKLLVYGLAPLLVKIQVEAKAPADKVRPVVEEYTKFVAPFGREVALNGHLRMAKELVRSDKTAALAQEEATKAVALVRPSDESARSLAVLKVLALAAKKTGKAEDARGSKLREEVYGKLLKESRARLDKLGEKGAPASREKALAALASALRGSGKINEAKQVDLQVAKLRDELDKEFAKDAIPFKVNRAAARKGESDRVVVVELFTGAQCPPCVSADIAFGRGVEAYRPSDAIFLEYHLHVPGPDPLTNTASEARSKYYGDEVEGTPTVFVDGKATEALGGLKMHAEDRFEKLSALIDKDREVEAQAKVKLSVTRKGDKIDLKAEVNDLKKAGEKVRLRFVLIEDVVSYAGRNRQRLHHHVVRALPGGENGFALKEATSTQNVAVDLAEVRQALTDYLDKYEEGGGEFLDEARPLELKKLKVVALIQNDDTKQILQAVQADVPE